jgi:hypothetical protein
MPVSSWKINLSSVRILDLRSSGAASGCGVVAAASAGGGTATGGTAASAGGSTATGGTGGTDTWPVCGVGCPWPGVIQ